MKSQSELVRLSRETSRRRHRRHPSRRGLAHAEHLLVFLGKPRTKGSRFARLNIKYGYYITGQKGMLVQQYDTTAGAGRSASQQPPIGCGLPGHTVVMYTGKHVCRYLYIAECFPSPLQKSHGSRLRFRATTNARSLPVPTSYVRKDTPLLRSML